MISLALRCSRWTLCSVLAVGIIGSPLLAAGKAVVFEKGQCPTCDDIEQVRALAVSDLEDIEVGQRELGFIGDCVGNQMIREAVEEECHKRGIYDQATIKRIERTTIRLIGEIRDPVARTAVKVSAAALAKQIVRAIEEETGEKKEDRTPTAVPEPSARRSDTPTSSKGTSTEEGIAILLILGLIGCAVVAAGG